MDWKCPHCGVKTGFLGYYRDGHSQAACAPVDKTEDATPTEPKHDASESPIENEIGGEEE